MPSAIEHLKIQGLWNNEQDTMCDKIERGWYPGPTCKF